MCFQGKNHHQGLLTLTYRHLRVLLRIKGEVSEISEELLAEFMTCD